MSARWGDILYWIGTVIAVLCVLGTVGNYVYWATTGLPAAARFVAGEGSGTPPWFMWLGALELTFMGCGAWIAGRGFRLSLGGQ